MKRVHVVNSSYECVGSCKMSRAISLISKCKFCDSKLTSKTPCTHNDGVHYPKAEVVKDSKRIVKTSKTTFMIPQIIRVFEHIPLYDRKIEYSNKMVWERDNYTCKYCGMVITSKSQLTTDHIKPKSKGGKKTFTNMVTACGGCNRRKANRSLADSGMKLLGPNPPLVPAISPHMMKVNEEIQEILRQEWKEKV